MKISIILITITFISCSISNAQYLKDSKLKDESSPLKAKSELSVSRTEKVPAIAGCLSFFVPGASLGQIYNEDYEKFALHFGISAAILTFAIVGNQIHLYELGFGDVGGGPGKEGKKEWIFVLCVLAYTGNWLWSTIDAIHSATMNNRELEQKRARLKSRTQKSINYNFGFGLDRNNRINFKTVLNF